MSRTRPEPVQLVAKPPMDRYGLPFMPGPFTEHGTSLPPRAHYRTVCPDCKEGSPHTPVLAVYEAALDAYAEATVPVCLARRRGRTHAARPAELCGAPAVKRFAGVDLCAVHYQHVIADAAKVITDAEAERARRESRDLRTATRELRAAARDYERAVAEAEADRRERIQPGYGTVYYLRREFDGMIKIGTSVLFRSRLNAHRSEHGALQILLICAGGYDEEDAAHRKFRTYQIGRTEWFRPARPVLEWICKARKDERHAILQPDDVLPLEDLRKLVRDAPRRKDLCWEDGVLMWPPEPLAA